MAGTCTLTLLSSKQADKVTDMFVSGLIHEALVQPTDTLRFFVSVTATVICPIIN